ncbi:hypothetical protein RP20_CCG002271 [Aedes albopictus]|nr:hypothetical protein RP20_CCG002271 [Aedes albopictus]
MTMRTQTDAIYTDLSAAFDKLNHHIAIAKLDRLGIGGSLLRWFRSYLTERQLIVAIGDSRSSSFCATSGIPQGSHLGLLIFLIYFNDVHLVLKVPRLSFADDLKLFLRIHSTTDCRLLQEQVNCFAEWCKVNRLTVNPEKCSCISFSRKKQPVPFDYKIFDTPIGRVFLIYFNDVHLVLKVPRLSFADDLKLFLRIHSTTDCRLLQEQVNCFAEWCKVNRLTVNPEKCSCISFSRKKQPVPFDYKIFDTPIGRVQCVKDLGVLLDSHLTYSHHISFVVDKASRTLGFVFRVAKNFIDIYCLKTLYCSLVRSTLEYGSAVWSPNYNNGTERIESVQRRFIRYALRRLPWRDPLRLPSYERRCQLIDLQPLRVRRDVCRALTVADTLQGRIDCDSILRQVNINVQPRLLRNSSMLRLPLRRNNYGIRSALLGLQRIFNRVASVFDFHLTRNVIKRRFTDFFNNLT